MRDYSHPHVLIAAFESGDRVRRRVTRGSSARLRRRWPSLAFAALGLAAGGAIAHFEGPLPFAAVVASAFVLVGLFKLGQGREEEIGCRSPRRA